MNYTTLLLVGVPVLVAVVILYFVAEEFQRIAAMKGHFEARYFWCSFLLGIVGWLMVIALPDHSEKVYYYPNEDESYNDNGNDERFTD